MLAKELDALRAAQQQLHSDVIKALDTRADLQGLINATAHANKALRRQALRASRLAGLSLFVALAAGAAAAAALLL